MIIACLEFIVQDKYWCIYRLCIADSGDYSGKLLLAFSLLLRVFDPLLYVGPIYM